MKIIITIIIWIVLMVYMVYGANAKVLWEDDFADYQLVNTNLIIRNTKIRAIDKFQNPYQCGYAVGGNGLAYIITLSKSDYCMENVDKYIVHEFSHIYFFQNDHSELAKKLPSIQGHTSAKEKLAYWFTDWYFEPGRIQVFFSKVYNLFLSL